MNYLRVKNWGKFQHYKNRTPPWIKFHTTLLEDFEICALPDETKAHLVFIWLLASRLDNHLPADPQWIAGKIGARSPINLEALIQAGFLEYSQVDTEQSNGLEQVASTPSAERYPSRTRVEAEAEAEAKNSPSQEKEKEGVWGRLYRGALLGGGSW